MAIQTRRIWSAPITDGVAFLEYDWEDTDGTLRVVRWQNATENAFHVDLVNVDASGNPAGKTYTDTIVAGTALSTRNVTGAARQWGITVDYRGRPIGVSVSVQYPFTV